MSEAMIIQHCSPTLAGLKTGNIFTCPYESEQILKENLRNWNRTLGKKGLRILPLRRSRNKAMLYVYRPALLSRDLQQDIAEKLLRERGYTAEKPELCVIHLMHRLNESEEFPHEIGLFLGYPPEDVCGFIEKAPCKYTGCWKVYTDVESAQKTFAKYHKCTAVYRKQYAGGKSIERLTVAS